MELPNKGQSVYAFVGTYGRADQEGIHVLRLDERSGELHQVSAAAGIANPSYLAVNRSGTRLYAVSETGQGEVAAFSFDAETGELKELNRRQTLGASPCYVCLSEGEDALFAVNYTGGNAARFPILPDGSVGELADNAIHRGSSVRPDRQEGPHPHSIVVVPGSPYLLVPDLGQDRLVVYRGDGGRLEPYGSVVTPAGSGPRHAAFHPTEPWMYVINELDATICAYRYDRVSGTFLQLQAVPTLPGGFGSDNLCADIHVAASGDYLYGSNRGHDSIAVYRIGAEGRLTLVGHVPTMGRTPRNFALAPDGKHLLAANQDSDSIVVMRIGDDGVPFPTGHRLEVSRPVCLKLFAPAAVRA